MSALNLSKAFLAAIVLITASASAEESAPAKYNRHALIVTIGNYSDPSIPSLPGTRIDKDSATKIAEQMQIPLGNIQYLSDEQATGKNIERAIQDLGKRVGDGDRVFIFYSGHGTRYENPLFGTKYQKADAPRCVEALLPFDGAKGAITNREMATLLEPITRKTDKLFVLYDSCFSGGIVSTAQVKTRSLGNEPEEFRPKFATTSDECGQAINLKTRNLVVEQIASGALPQDIVHLSAARENEASLDGAGGGLATQSVRDCMLGGAVDLDNSGAISIEEIRACAQGKIDKQLAGNGTVKPHHLVVNGNTGFIPSWFNRPSLNPAPKPQADNNRTKPEAASSAKPTVTQKPETLDAATLAVQQIFEQRSGKRKVEVSLNKTNLLIGKDTLEFSVKSDKPGYLYIVLAGSDGKSLYLLLPNDIEKSNKLTANQAITYPNSKWKIKAAGPAGTDKLLFIVSDEPRDLSQLHGTKQGPYLHSLNDAQGRSQLGAFLTSSKTSSKNQCRAASKTNNNGKCSDAFGAVLLDLKESNE